MTENRPSLLTNLATIGLAVGGPATLLSGLITFVTVPTGVPGPLIAVFVLALSMTVLSAAIYLIERMKTMS